MSKSVPNEHKDKVDLKSIEKLHQSLSDTCVPSYYEYQRPSKKNKRFE